ncbi:hypothetical protein ASG65_26460 [Bacillus sp. Leaf13]|nr:hypothetical protein ASG65_26460 [Bacillus sp. Leaf13]
MVSHPLSLPNFFSVKQHPKLLPTQSAANPRVPRPQVATYTKTGQGYQASSIRFKVKNSLVVKQYLKAKQELSREHIEALKLGREKKMIEKS